MFGSLTPQEAAARGGKARAARLRAAGTLSDVQRKARAAVSSASCSANGAKGFAAFVAKHHNGDREAALRQLWSIERQRRMENPSSAEKRMMDTLNRMGVAYEREYLVSQDEWIAVDFALPGQIALLVDGPCHYDPVLVKEKTILRDAYLNSRLPELGWTVLRIRDTEIETASTRIMELVDLEIPF